MSCVTRPFAGRSSTVPVRLAEAVGVVDAGRRKDDVDEMHLWDRSDCCYAEATTLNRNKGCTVIEIIRIRFAKLQRISRAWVHGHFIQENEIIDRTMGTYGQLVFDKKGLRF